ncbi:MAG: methyl-accepting chemotaxis protein [Fibrobacterota bacterium]
MNLRNISIQRRFLIQLTLLFLFLAGMIGVIMILTGRIADFSGREVSRVMHREKEQKIAVATHAMARSIADLLPRDADREATILMIRTAVDRIRFENDSSGYFFVYEKTTNIALPTDKKLQGKDLKDLADDNGVHLVKQLYAKAKEGGGFVEYIWPKPGAGTQPKLSYAEMIPGTDFWIGTGVYMDNVAAEKAAVTESINQKSTAVTRLVTLVVIVVFALILLPLNIGIIRSVVGPIRTIHDLAATLAHGDTRRDITPSGNDEITRMEEAFASMVISLREKAAVSRAIAERDLTVPVQVHSQEDELGTALETMQVNLNELISSIRDATVQIDAGSNELSNMSQDLSESNTNQASAVQEISSSVHEVAAATDANVESTQTAETRARAQVETAERGSSAVEQLETAITRITTSSDQMKKIISVINNIAFQTNLLALNAAVEAARAGKHGKGFSVVAEEVRTLAGRSAKASDEISELIEDAVERARNGSAVTRDVTEVFARIREGAESVSNDLSRISEGSQEQRVRLNEINRGISDIEESTMNNTASAEETASTAEELSSQSEDLRHRVSLFRTMDGQTSGSSPHEGPHHREDETGERE